MSVQPELELPPNKPAESTTATSSAMIALLRRHYLPDETRPGGIFAPEIQAPGALGALYNRRDEALRTLKDHQQHLKADYDRIGRLLGEAS